VRGFFLAFLGLTLALGCAPRRRDAGAESSAGRFPHEAPPHAQLGCTTCHDEAVVVAGGSARPGADDHAPCDRAKCHAAEFLGPPTTFCALCHDAVTPWREGETTLAAYPPRRGPRAYPSTFSHQLHLDTRRMDRRAGFHVGCGDCHAGPQRADLSPEAIARLAISGDGGGGDAPLPGHAACGRCHDRQPPTMATCAGCHASKRPATRQRRLITGDLSFSHEEHVSDVAGRAITCATCHARVAGQTKASQTDLPAIAACVTCHDDSKRAPESAAMSVCGRCHAGSRDTFQRLVAPRSHLAERFRPDDHTLAFRRDHTREAQADADRCARCHGGMSGQTRANCDECHQTMRPADHLVSWREYDHGPEAAASPDRCAVCHEAEVCTACHSRPPRSHSVPDFAAAGHGRVAQFRLRSCFHCHTPERECSGCHTGFSP
jgi:Cytochrome c7 and related cytochrome c